MKDKGTSQIYNDRFDCYYDLMTENQSGTITKGKIKYILSLMNFKVDLDRLNVIMMLEKLDSSLSRAEVRSFIEVYSKRINGESTVDDRIIAINREFPSHLHPVDLQYLVKTAHRSVILDWREYEIYQLIQDDEISLEGIENDCSSAKIRKK